MTPKRAMAARNAAAAPTPSPRIRAARPVRASNQLQAKLKVGAQSDTLEREADLVSVSVMRGETAPPLTGSRPSTQRRTADAPHPGASGTTASPSLGGGAPMPPALRDYFEPRFDESFVDVRIHTDGAASGLALALGARAFTLGRDIGFAPGEYAPGAPHGRAVIAHELAHVVQQRGGAGAQTIRLDLQTEALRRSLMPSDLEAASAEQLQTLHAFLEELWLSHKGTNWADEDAILQNLAVVRAALIDKTRDPAPAVQQEKAKPPLIPGMKGGDDAAQLHAAAGVIDGLRQTGSDINEIEVQGQTYRLTDAKAAEIRSKVRSALVGAINRAKGDADYAINGYNFQSEVDKKHWIVSNFVKIVGRIEDPWPKLQQLGATAFARAALAAAAVQNGNFTGAADALAQAETAGRQARLMFQAYWQDIISTGEFTVTVLEYTRNVSFIILAIAATIVTAGAAAGVTSIGGVGLGAAGSANLIATAAPVLAQFGEAGAKLAAGDKVDWGDLAIDTVVTIIMYRFGGALAGKIGGRLIGSNPAARTLGRQVVANIVSGVIVGRGSAVVQIGIKNIYAKLSGKNVTWDSFLDQVAQMLLDPKQAFMDLMLGAIGGYGAVRGAKPGGGGGGSGPAKVAPAKTEPTAQTPAIHEFATKPAAAQKVPANPVAGEPSTQVKAPAPVQQAEPAAPAQPAQQAKPAEPAPQTKAIVQDPAAQQPAKKAAGGPGELTIKQDKPRVVEPAPLVQQPPAKPLANAELVSNANAALAKLKAAKATPDGITAHDLNAVEAALKALRLRQAAAPDPGLRTALEAATTDYSDAIHSTVSLQGAGPTTVSGQSSAAQARKDAVASGLENLAEGRPGLQSHSTSSKTRGAVGTSGATHQSAHLVPQAVDRAIGASAGKALTVNLPTDLHRQIDGDWVPKWNGAVARGEKITGADVQKWVGEAIQKVPNSMLPQQPGTHVGPPETHPLKNTLEWRLNLELKELGIGPGTVIVPAKP